MTINNPSLIQTHASINMFTGLVMVIVFPLYFFCFSSQSATTAMYMFTTNGMVSPKLLLNPKVLATYSTQKSKH